MNTYDDDRGDDIRNALEARLAAVIALTADLPDRGPFLPLLNKIRAAATGDTK